MMEVAPVRMFCIEAVLSDVFCVTMSATECAVALTLTLIAIPSPSSTPPTNNSNMNGTTMANSVAATPSAAVGNFRRRNNSAVIG